MAAEGVGEQQHETEPRAGSRPRAPDVLERAHQARLLQVGQMLAGIVHEIKNPLAVIQGYAQLLHDRDEPGSREELSAILQETQRLAALVEDMLAFVRRGGDALGRVDLSRAVAAAVNLTTHAMRQARVSVSCTLPPEPVAVRGQHGAYVQVLLNLLSNARQSLAEGRERDRRVTILVEPGGDGPVSVLLANNGPPIPPEHRAAIFDPFFTTRSEGEGTGLGLPLCREILARFGATIGLLPGDEAGVTFRLELPRA